MHKWSKHGNINSLCIFEKFTIAHLGNANVNGYKYLFDRIGTMINEIDKT